MAEEREEKKMAKINKEEYKLLKGLEGRWKWIARDLKDSVLSDELWIYEYKPKRESNFWAEEWGEYKDLPHHLFRFIQWDDFEPYNIQELIDEYEEESEGTEVKKDKEWLLGTFRSRQPFNNNFSKGYVLEKVKQLDEPEFLSQEFINEKAVEVYSDTEDAEIHVVFRMRDLQNLLVPKQEEVDQADKDGEPETVADVVIAFWKSYERLKEVMNMEVEELEE